MYRAADGPQQVQVPWPPSRPPPGVFGVRVRQRASEAQSWCAEVDSHAHVRTVRLSLQERPDETYWALADDAAGLEQFLRQGARGLKVSLKLGALQLLGHGALGSVLRAAAQSGASVTHLDLSSNGLGDDVAEEIARFAECQDDVSLSELQLANNRISALGLAQICAALAGRQAGEGSAGGAATLRLPGPCWLDLRGNAVDRPREVARCLDELGVPTCPGARCCRQRCLVSAPVHLAGGLVPQRAARRWRSEELAEALQQISQRPPPPRVPRPPRGAWRRQGGRRGAVGGVDGRGVPSPAAPRPVAARAPRRAAHLGGTDHPGLRPAEHVGGSAGPPGSRGWRDAQGPAGVPARAVDERARAGSLRRRDRRGRDARVPGERQGDRRDACAAVTRGRSGGAGLCRAPAFRTPRARMMLRRSLAARCPSEDPVAFTRGAPRARVASAPGFRRHWHRRGTGRAEEQEPPFPPRPSARQIGFAALCLAGL
ncbi:unnamed protein product [Prorocentrum cordatum]|uniref:Uncharacterized protein n=1 Tax=Prorocentrum cordatum TaxID=2364126 RepID=A0ABN9QPR7_9DINO|nr:unnamed protein product [Polarella glacialis]